MLGLGLTSMSARPAVAAPITYMYGGTISSDDPTTAIAPGTRFEGTFTYDPATQPFKLTTEGMAVYTFGIPPSTVADTSNLTLRLGGQPLFSGQGLSVTVSDQSDATYGLPPGSSTHVPPSSQWNLLAHNDLVGVSLNFVNPGQSLNPSLSLTHAYSLNDFPIAQLLVTGRANKTGVILYSGSIDMLAPVPVPEPTTLAMLAVTFAGLAVRRHLKCNRRDPR